MSGSKKDVKDANNPEKGDLVFDCNFESGNVGDVERIDEFEWNVSIREDTNNPKYRIWFYFRITNVKKNQRVLLHFHNYSKKKALFREGFTPIVRSSSRWRWERIPPKQLFYSKCVRHKWNYCFTVAFMFDKPNDEYFFAYSYPYTYTDLQRYLHNLDGMKLRYYRRELLCRTVQNRRLDLLCISAPHNLRRFPLSRYTRDNSHLIRFLSQVSGGTFAADGRAVSTRALHSFLASLKSCARDVLQTLNADIIDQTWYQKYEEDKDVIRLAEEEAPPLNTKEKMNVVVITARVHPGETPASYVCHGIINFLLSNDPAARCLRDHTIFYVVPMLNPDGVVLGNHRCSSMGLDLNRYWLQPDPLVHPTIARVKNFLMNLAGDPRVDLDKFIDVHAHTTTLAGFMYMNTSVDDPKMNDEFPRLLDLYCPHFSYDKCRSNKHGYKAGTGRRSMGDLLSMCHTACYTLEVSYFCSLMDGVQGEPYTEETFKQIGRDAAFSFMALYKLLSLLRNYKADKNFSINMYEEEAKQQ